MAYSGYHACIDEGLGDGHDDPQKFDLDKFSGSLDEVIRSVNKNR
jgi:hypothetical protein